MLENYEHYISRNIKTYYKRKIFSPAIYLLLLFIVWQIFSLTDILFPAQLDATHTLGDMYRNEEQYVSAELTGLHFTGYTRTFLGNTTGYYYYTFRNDECFFVLLSPKTCEEGLPVIPHLSLSAVLSRGDNSYQILLDNVAKDLNWTANGIRSKVSGYYLSEPDYNPIGNTLIFGFIFITGIYALISLSLSIIFINFPHLSPPCQDLGLFGNAKQLLAQAEEELATLPQLATEDIFITEHFFIMTSFYANAIIPIDEIIWIYKYSTMHKFFWYHFSISYTLHISAKKHLYLQCPKNVKSDIDGIIDYLAEANHDILVGFNEKNRLKAQEIQGNPLQIEKLANFLKKRI
ncbi:MAG: hypothetical protein IKU69_05425 [Roseburia sp.]|nr:hypothetical protein [Roseburia sp.]